MFGKKLELSLQYMQRKKKKAPQISWQHSIKANDANCHTPLHLKQHLNLHLVRIYFRFQHNGMNFSLSITICVEEEQEWQHHCHQSVSNTWLVPNEFDISRLPEGVTASVSLL